VSEDRAEESPLKAIKDALDVDKDGRVSPSEVLEVGEEIATRKRSASIFTLPVAALELVAAGITVVMVSPVAEDMEPVVYATAFVIGFFLIAAFHYLIETQRRLVLWFFLAWKTFLSLFLATILWERSLPHDVWTGEGFRDSGMSIPLQIAAGIMVLTAVALIAARVVLSTGRWVKKVVEDA
jgi:hypothetical protein